ncbi:MAG: dihydrolipoyl dehydrogenase, partial [Myxococcales bacterium]|nr:dihydrolipoyl dehydrogenase [Myxococcales bacterium]
GCIPSKALISASKLVAQLKDAARMGIHVDGVRLDLGQMMGWKQSVVEKLTGGVGHLVKGNGGRVVSGDARFVGPHVLAVTEADGGVTTIRFEHAVIATGSTPAALPGFAFDGKSVMSSTEALDIGWLPDRLVVIGGGYIGMELGGVYQRLGTAVTVVEYMDRILPGFAQDLVRPVAKRFREHGGTVLTAMKALSWEAAEGGGVKVLVESLATGEKRTLEADAILLTTGRKPRTEGLGLAAVGLSTDARGFLEVDGEQRTSVPHILAIGDVAGEPMLAHKASKEGEVAAEVIAGHAAAYDVRAVPAVVFTDPEIAVVGMTAAEAEAAGHTAKTGKFAFAANGRALSLNDADGFVRVTIDAETKVMLGMEVVGPEASNLIAEVALAIELGATAEDIGLT